MSAPIIHLVERQFPFRGPTPYGIACSCGLSMIEAFDSYIAAARAAYEHEREHALRGGIRPLARRGSR